MRILITSFTYAPQANGVAEVVEVHANGFVRRGHEVTVATSFDPARTAVLTAANPQVVEFKIGTGPDPGRPFGEDMARYRQFLRDAPVDVILCHCWQGWNTDLAIAALPDSRAKKIMVSHGFSAHRWMLHGKPPWGLGQWWRARSYVRELPRMLRVFDHVVFLSPKVDRDRFYDHWVLERHGGPSWSAIPNGTLPQKFAAPGPDFRREHHVGNAFLVLYVALYAENKNQEAAVRAFLHANLDDAVLVLIGNELNDYARHVQATARRLLRGRRGRVLFLEKQSKEMIRAAYRAMDLFLMTSKQETQPLVLLDSMGCGKPFLSTAVGCVGDFPGGLVVSTRSEMIKQMRILRASVARRTELGRKGLEAVKATYHWESVLDTYDVLLHRLVR